MAPWDDQELLEEQDAIDRTTAVSSRRARGCKDAARLAMIAIGNYVWMSQDWPALVDRANELLTNSTTRSRAAGDDVPPQAVLDALGGSVDPGELKGD